MPDLACDDATSCPTIERQIFVYKGAISAMAEQENSGDGSQASLFKAAQYVRMSTEHQQYSTENQGDKIREYAAHRLDTVLDKFLKTMQTTAIRLQEELLKPEVRQKGKEQVKEKAPPPQPP